MWAVIDSRVSTATLGGSEYLLQHTLGDLHVLHGDDLAEFLQGVNVPDLIHELHAAETVNNIHLIFRNDPVLRLLSLSSHN